LERKVASVGRLSRPEAAGLSQYDALHLLVFLNRLGPRSPSNGVFCSLAQDRLLSQQQFNRCETPLPSSPLLREYV